MDPPSRHAHPHSRHQRLRVQRRFDLGRRWRHRYRRRPRQPSQPGFQADSELRVITNPGSSPMRTLAALALLVYVGCEAGEATPPYAIDAQTAADSVFADALGAQLKAATAADQFSGAVLVARDGRTLFEGAYGLADRERGISNTPLTQFRVGSMNKMLTAVAALQLVQAGKVRLDAPIGTYLTDYPNAEVASKVTPHHLLTHTGGTGDIFGPQFSANILELRTTADYLRLYGARGLQFAPGAQFAYSNYGFILLGAIIERVSGMSYDEYVAAHVLAPAGMTATG